MGRKRKPYHYDSDSTPFSRRLQRSLDNPLRLLHRSASAFFVLGSAGKVYTVTLSATPTCDCPDPTTPCKHILFVYIRVLSLPQNDPCLQSYNLLPCQLTRLLSAEVSDEAVAGASIRRRFRELYRRRRDERKRSEKVGDGSTCHVCLGEMGVGGVRLVACGACRGRIIRWRDGDGGDDKYIDLSAYVSEDEDDSEYECMAHGAR
ncbi:hypothetical protein SSX86_033147 [Deinandra increscens subsp. villosa]|uniref:SWIM-type domain-containing protein n=1 Tax=Deinandra increscens subsp. villosa TaxID=3103831 RepID=A0AAP0C2H6_9ASTR